MDSPVSTPPKAGSMRSALWDLMAGQRGRYLAACGLLAGGTAMTYLAPLIIRAAIDGLLDPNIAPGQRSWLAGVLRSVSEARGMGVALLLAAGMAVAITSLGGMLVYLKGRLAARATENIIQALRRRLYDHLQHVEMAWHDKAQTGDIVQRCTSDVETVRSFYSSQVIEIVQNSMRVLIVVPVLVWLDWKMAIAATCLMPLIVGGAFFFFSRVQGRFKKSDEAEGAMTATLQENLTGIRVVRAFARQEFEIGRFREKNEANRLAMWRLMKLLAIYWSSSDLLCFSQSALVLIVGINRVMAGDMTVGTAVAFVTYGQIFIWPLREVGRTLTELGKALVSIGRIQEVLAAPRESTPATNGQPVAMPANPVRGEIDIRDLHFRYGEQEVLRGVTLHIPAGSTVALLGPSGSGKTTLINLLLRMYDYSQGSITLDGVALPQMDRKAVREQFGVVLQEPFLFSKSLADNIRLGRHTAGDDEMHAASHVAAIHETIVGFEDGYQTLIGERGVTLSGGQRQRTAIARALLRDAPILILDDALSAVDTHTETAILHALRQRRERRTTIVIAHRLSTLMHADQIAVMEQGRIVQLGTHDELVAREGLYRRLWQIQSALEEDLRGELTPDDTQGEPMLAPAR